MTDQLSVTGIVEYWTLHILTEFMDPEVLTLHYPNAIPVKLTGLVVEDYRGRFPQSAAMQSSLLRGFDLQNMLVHTLNSTYQLKGIGSFSYVRPQSYDYEVGMAMARIAAQKSKITLH